MYLKCHIYKLVHVYIWDNYVSTDISDELSDINSVTMSTTTYTFHIMTYAPEQICLPHHTCRSTALKLWATFRPPITAHIRQNNYNFYLPCYNHICANKKHVPKMWHICYMSITSSAHMRKLCQYICTSHQLHAFNNVNRSTGIHTFHITDICPWTNMPATTTHICSTALLL